MRGDSFAHLGVGVRRSCWSDARDECLSSSTTFVPSVAVPSESVENVLSIAAQPSSQVAKSLEARRYLVKAQREHDLFVSAYTPEGTLSYDERIMFFNMRYEAHTDSDETALTASLREAESFLQTMGFTHKPLKATAVDVSQIWNSPSEVTRDN